MTEANLDVISKVPGVQEPPTLYVSESHKKISLDANQKDAIRSITLGIEEVDQDVRSMAVPDVIHTLESGHPLNRLITNDDGDVTGYIACEDFVPHEAYIKYLGTTKQTGRNLLKEIPDFLEYAQKQGYKKLSFHGWNNRLNNILERYGFERVRTEGDTQVGYYEKSLIGRDDRNQAKSEKPQVSGQERNLKRIKEEYQKTVDTFSSDLRQGKEAALATTFQTLSRKLASKEGFQFGETEQAILKLKLARHFQKAKPGENIDINTLQDALLESPKFISTDKGSLQKLFEIHQVKTLQKIAEARKRRAEIGDKTTFNPYENLFTTKSGEYHMTRLLNMPHLEQESEYMKHCVGTSDSYINQMKRGEIEILSFRNVPKINDATQRLEGDTPIITFEYNLKTKTIEQMKKYDDAYLSPDDPYYQDVIDALKQLRTTQTDRGDLRDFVKISPSELDNIQVDTYSVLTENGPIPFREFDFDAGVFVLKAGEMLITPDLSREDVGKIVRLVEGINCKPEEIAQNQEQITAETKVYIGKPTPGIFDLLPRNVEHIYASFPEGKVSRESIMAGGIPVKEYEEGLKQKGGFSGYAGSLMENPDFVTLTDREPIDLITLRVQDLGFTEYPTTDQLYEKASELGLELCPPEVGPDYLLQNPTLDMYEWRYIAMKPITDSGGRPGVFGLARYGGGLWLGAYWAGPAGKWGLDGRVVFRHRKLNS